ncbi:sulfite exporter TauE/SafE family protein [Pollutibacter soli]|uniref:sulfite exporter TauE/SafE family protein n=1 Tax=Pollutibacter soli TaxID=3034157 RepID=UPI0030137D41
MELAGYLASILIGISLGLIGGGGSILTVPVLVYLFHIDAGLATTNSLFIVGATSVVGSLSYFRKGLVHIPTAIVFGLPSVAAVFLTRAFVLPAIPEHVFSIGDIMVTKNMLLLLLFALLMIGASYSMIKTDHHSIQMAHPIHKISFLPVLLQGLFTGLITGLVGAGGGFLVIPALVHWLKLPMKTAVGTSLFIIAVNSLAGFFFSVKHAEIHWHFLLIVASIAIVGILIGSYFSTKIQAQKLKPVFGWFVLVMGLYIIIRETIVK